MTGTGAADPYAFGRAEPPNELADKLKPTPIEGVRAARLPNRNLLVTQGTSIPCVLETAMSSDVAGFVSCVVIRDVISDSGNVVLMEKGTQVVGEYRGNVRRGSKRMFVLWSRAKTPTGVIVALASPATDALGRAGFDGDIDTHFGSDLDRRCCYPSWAMPAPSGVSSFRTARSKSTIPLAQQILPPASPSSNRSTFRLR